MCLWQRLVFIILYLLLIVVSSWILEWILLFETGYASYQIVEPLNNLSVPQLQALLTSRGIQVTSLLEKPEIIEAIQQTGKVHYLELLSAIRQPESTWVTGPVEILGNDEYIEQVLEERESIWVIEIIPQNGTNFSKRILNQKTWHKLDTNLRVVGINAAIIRCAKDPSLCERQGWKTPQLMLAVPFPGVDSKRMFHLTSANHISVNSVLHWVKRELLKLTVKVQSTDDVQSKWINTTLVKETKVPRMIYITDLLNPPLLLVALGLRFSSRLKFSSFSTKRLDKEVVSKFLNSHNLAKPPNLVLTSSSSVTSYGKNKGEVLTLSALEVYVRLLQPRINDVFLISLMVTNFLVFVDFLDFRGPLWKHLMRTLFSIPVYNLFIFVVWLAFSAFGKMSFMKPVIDAFSSLFYELVTAGILNVLVYHAVLIEHFKGIALVSFVLFGLLLFSWRWVMGRPMQDAPDQDGENWYTLFPMDSYLVNVLFRPMASLSRPRPSQDFDLEEGMEQLIQRLATPDLWLHPVQPTEYMKDLPCWRYDGWGNEDDLKSESETDLDSFSDTENELLLESHMCCQDDSCKMCSLWSTVKETYVCHRCAMLKRKLEKKYLRFRDSGDNIHRNNTYEKLLKVCENCLRPKKNNAGGSKTNYSLKEKSRRQWLISAQRLNELKWSAPPHAIESRVCAICLDKYRWSAVLCGLPCGHTYHHSCIMEWLSKDNHQCPTCRWPTYKSKVNM